MAFLFPIQSHKNCFTIEEGMRQPLGSANPKPLQFFLENTLKMKQMCQKKWDSLNLSMTSVSFHISVDFKSRNRDDFRGFVNCRVPEPLIHDMDEFLIYDTEAMYEMGLEEEYKHISMRWTNRW